MKLCGHCKIRPRKNNGKDRYCLICHASYMKTWRKTHPLAGLARKKANARAYTRQYIKRGHIKKLPCEVCGEKKSQVHHKDYNKPLEIIWLCRLCHMKHHENSSFNLS